jgi:hypothetical protein
MAGLRFCMNGDAGATPAERCRHAARARRGKGFVAFLLIGAAAAAGYRYESCAWPGEWLSRRVPAGGPASEARTFHSRAFWIDLNHDDRPDSVAVVPDGDGGETIQIRLNGLAYQELKLRRTERRSRSVVYTADVDQDTNLDLVSASEGGIDPPIVWLGDGRGNFVRLTRPALPAGDSCSPPTLPGDPTSPRGSRGSATWVNSPAARRAPARFAKRSPYSRIPLRVPGDAPRRPAMAVRTRRELLSWISRTIKAPPGTSSSAA